MMRLPFLVFLVMSLMLTGCLNREPPPQHEIMSFTTSAAAAEAGRVGVLPFFSADAASRTSIVMGESMAAGLRELGLHEVLLVSAEQRDRLMPKDLMLANRMHAEDLLKIRDQLRVDAVLIGRIEHFDSFDPISMGVTATLISCHDGEVLWSATGHFDGHRQDIQDEIRHWYDKTLSNDTHPLSGWKVVLESPRLFTRYVADRLALSIPLVPEPKSSNAH